MGVKHITRAAFLLAGALAVAAQVTAIELGELQAVPGSPPPYIFRLALVSTPGGPSDMPAVTVRQPHHAISFVKNDRLELRLRSLTDVELEVSQGGQTLNRLLLKGELQTARARLDAMMAWRRYQAAKAKGSPRPQLAAQLDAAYQSHQSWLQFDPAAARQPFAQVEQERLRLLTTDGQPPEPGDQASSIRAQAVAEAKVPALTPELAPERAGLDREIQVLRAEIQRLVGRVTPWEGPAMPTGPREERVAAPLIMLILGGLVIAGVTSLCTAYWVQHRALERERQRRRSLAASLRRARAGLPARTSTRAAVQQTQLARHQRQALEPATVVRRVRVSHKARRRVRVRTWRDSREATQEGAEAHTRIVAQVSQTRPSAPIELAEALANLQRQLTKLQRLLPTSASLERPEAGPGRAAR
jgi:hypothetical protein